MKHKLMFLIGVTVLLFALVSAVGAYPLQTEYQGPTPLYDSGFVPCEGDGELQAFAHNLHDLPLFITVHAAEDVTPRPWPPDPTPEPIRFIVFTMQHTFWWEPGSAWYGYLVQGMDPGTVFIKWREYLAVREDGTWLEADDEYAYVRVQIWSTLEMP